MITLIIPFVSFATSYYEKYGFVTQRIYYLAVVYYWLNPPMGTHTLLLTHEFETECRTDKKCHYFCSFVAVKVQNH